jgi:deoxyribodipyrimidine photo-lyase
MIARFELLPAWAQKTLNNHTRDEREHTYSLGEFESARTHDPLWDAVQVQIVRKGKIHNYLRMLWEEKNPRVVPLAAGSRGHHDPAQP